MSHCRAAFRFEDGSIMFAEYDGCIDRVCSPAVLSHDAVTAGWRNSHNPECDCEKELCEMFEDYGGGLYLYALVCRIHGSIEHGDVYENYNRKAFDGSTWGHSVLGSEFEEYEE